MLGSVLLMALTAGTSVLGQAAGKCSLSNKCPESAPCCSQYGDCGVGAFCLGGCDPRMSFSIESCAPAPVCKSKNMKFDNVKDSIVNINRYLGDSSKADWVSQGEVTQLGNNALLTMAEKTAGTVLASTTYMWYGNVKARMKTSKGRGVVTAFILMSDVKDEIDYEWVGVDLKTSQTNYYFQGIPDYHNSGNISMTDSFDNFHDYEIRWTPDKIEWLVDGEVHRTKNKKDTWNATSQAWDFPQTPARVQLSIWPAGQPSNPEGTVNWAGGLIDWSQVKGSYYYATMESVSIECYKTDSAPGTNKRTSYTYKSAVATNNTVIDGDRPTIMGSFAATGADMDKGKKVDKDSKTPSTDGQNTIPGGGSPGGQDHSGDAAKSGGSPTNGDPKTCDPTKWNQKCGGDANGKSGGSKASASAFAIIVAASVMFWL